MNKIKKMCALNFFSLKIIQGYYYNFQVPDKISELMVVTRVTFRNLFDCLFNWMTQFWNLLYVIQLEREFNVYICYFMVTNVQLYFAHFIQATTFWPVDPLIFRNSLKLNLRNNRVSSDQKITYCNLTHEFLCSF